MSPRTGGGSPGKISQREHTVAVKINGNLSDERPINVEDGEELTLDFTKVAVREETKDKGKE